MSVLPSGYMTVMPLFVSVMESKGRLVCIIFSSIPVFSIVYAWAVAPVSTEVLYGLVVNDDKLIELFILWFLSSLPSCHVDFLGFGFIVFVSPPILLLRVASFTCPSFGYLHVLLVCLRLRPIPCVQQ